MDQRLQQFDTEARGLWDRLGFGFRVEGLGPQGLRLNQGLRYEVKDTAQGLQLGLESIGIRV